MKKIKALFSVLLCLMMICGYSVNYVSANDTEIVNETSDDTTIEEANNEKEEDVETENTETTKTEEETPKTTAASTKEVPSAKAAGVTVNTTSATLVDMSSVTGDIEIKSDGLYVGGTSVGETTLNPNGYEFSGTTTTNNITVSKDVEAILYLNNLNMTISKAGGCINVSHSNTTIILRNGSVNNLINKLNIGIWGFGYAAIYKNGSDGNLTITCDRQIAEGSSYRITNNSGALNTTDGTLNVSSTGVHQSGIGSSYHGTRGIYDEDNSFANLYVKGGLIYAKGGIHGSGIGSGCGVYLQTGGKSTAKNMNFSGGYIEAYANGGGAGIGGGHSTPVDGLYFSNGVQVVAYGASYSPGIGSGGNGDDYVASESSNATGRYDVKNLVISGGETKVTAYGDKNSNTPGIGSGHVNPGFNSADHKGVLSNVTATPETNYQGYVKYGTSDTDYSYSTANPKTPFPTSEEFGTYLQNESDKGNPVYYTQVYFGPYKDNNDIDENAEIGSNDTVSKTGGAAFTEAQLKSLTNPTGHDKDGNAIDFSSYTLDADEVAKINAAKTAGLVGDFPLTYTYSYTDDEGKTHDLKVTSTVSLRENGTDSAIDASLPSIAANDANYKTGGAAFKDQELIELCDALANNSQGMNANIYDTDGNLTIAEGFTIDADQKAALNAAKQAGETGDFPLTFTYTENGKTVTTTVTVSLRGNGTTNSDKDKSIPEMGSNDTIQKTGGSAYTEDEVKTMTSLVAKDKDGNDLDLSKVVITQSDLDKLNDAKTAGKTGDFPITYTYTDEAGNKTTVTSTVSLRDNATTGAQGTSTAEQGGNDKTLQDSDGTVTNEDLINKCQVVAINKNGAKVDTSTLTPNQEQLDKINTMITANRDGTYPMSWTTPDGEITPSKALELAKVELSGDRKIDLTNVTVDQTQLDYINQMIKEGKLDSYPLTFTDNLTGETVTINVTLTKTEVPVVEEKDPTITSTVKNGSTNGSSTSKVKTGDNVNISTYVLLGIIGLSGLVLIRKKKEN